MIDALRVHGTVKAKSTLRRVRLFLERPLHDNFAFAHHDAAAGDDVGEPEVFRKEAGVAAGALRDDALVRKAERRSDVRRDKGQRLFDRHAVVSDETLEGEEVAFYAAHAEARHFALLVKARHGPVTVGGKRDELRVDPGFEGRENGERSIVETARSTRRDVDVTALEGKLDRGVEDVTDAAAVGRADMTNGEPARDDFIEHRKGARDVPEVNVEEPGLARDHAADADVGEEREHLLGRGEGAAVVAECDLDTEHFRNEEEVVRDRVREGRRGIAIIRRVHPSRDAFGFEGADLRKKVRDGAGGEVRARNAHNARRTRADEFGEYEFGRAGRGTAFAAAPRHVDVLIEKARCQNTTRGVDRFKIGKVARQIGTDRCDLLADHEDVLTTEIVRGENAGVFNEKSHVEFSESG